MFQRLIPPPIEADAPKPPVYWRVGEHAAVVGTTGTGKTYLVSKLVDYRTNVVVLRTKPDDIEFTYKDTKQDGSVVEIPYPVFRTSKAMDDWRNNRILIRPKYEEQPRECYDVLEKVWKMGRWTIVVDEFFYVQRLGLMRPLERLLTQGRSKRISLVLGMQRPVQVTRFALSEITHLFAFRIEGRDLRTLKDSTHPDIFEPTKSLEKYQFMHYHVPTKSTRIGTAQTLKQVLKPLRETLDDVIDIPKDSDMINTEPQLNGVRRRRF